MVEIVVVVVVGVVVAKILVLVVVVLAVAILYGQVAEANSTARAVVLGMVSIGINT